MAQRVVEDSAELHDVRLEPKLMRTLEMVAPGTALREGLDAVSQAQTGALIVVGDPEELAFMFSGGIKLDLDYSPSMLYQLAKMDGAIIISANGTKIAWANVQLLPDPTISSNETGTRHRTAERVAKQSDAIAICVSQRRDVVSIYVDAAKYVMVGIPEVLAKANQALATLDKFRRRFDRISARLTVQEFAGRATLHDVLILFQRAEMISRMAVEIERFNVELGTEGRLIEMQLEETMIGVAGEKQGLVRDYIADDSDEHYAQVVDSLARMSHQDLLDFGRLAELFGYDRKMNTIDFGVAPRGYRILSRIPRLPKLVIHNITNEFGGLDALLDATDSELEAVEGVGDVRAKEIREGLKRLQEINMVDRYMQT